MIWNHLKIAWRTILRNKGYSAINLLGLTVGIACFLSLFLFVRDELSYDRHHSKAEQIYRLNRTFLSNDGSPSLRLGHVAAPFGPLIKEHFPEVQEVVRLFGTSALVRKGEMIFKEENLFAADESLFRVFDFHILKGNAKEALKAPFSVMLSRPMAEKYFGKEEPVGQVLRLDNLIDYQVTGVFEPLPEQSSFHPEFLVSFSTLQDEKIYGAERLRTDWGHNSFAMFLLLADDADPAALEEAFPAFQDKHVGPKTSDFSVLSLTPLTDIYLHSHLDSEMETNSDIRYVYYFSAIAVFILLIASINYMNLTTARASKRAREIGLKKVLGVSKNELVRQFLSESILFTILALVLALLLAWGLLPQLNEFSGKSMALSDLLSAGNLAMLLLFVVAVALLSGSYPAFYLTSFQPVTVLKGRLSSGAKSGMLRQSLVVVQFSIAVLLIACTMVVHRQLQYMKEFDLGYKKDQVVVLRGVLNGSQFASMRQDLIMDSRIQEVGKSSRIPTGRLLDSWDAKIKQDDSLVPSEVTLKMLTIDDHFLPAYQIKMAAGRNFSSEFPTDSTSGFILNRAATDMLGWRNAEEALGKQLVYGSINGTIVGVSENYHFESLHRQIPPLIMLMGGGTASWISIRVKGGDMPATIAHIASVWSTYFPDRPFDYDFLDNRYGALYAKEHTQQVLVGVFAGIAILISCLGLLGLSMYMTELRVKEIGIRKVLGASVTGVVRLLSMDFIRLVVVSIFIATPLAWWVMTRWLEGFAYRAQIHVGLFTIAGLAAVMIALFTVSFQSIRAALANPVKSLRAE